MRRWSHHFFAFRSFQIRFQFQTIVSLITAAAISIDSLSIRRQYGEKKFQKHIFFLFSRAAHFIITDLAASVG